MKGVEKSLYLPSGFIKHVWKIPYEMEVVLKITDFNGPFSVATAMFDDTTEGPFLGAEAMTFTLVGFCTLSHAMYTVQLPLGS